MVRDTHILKFIQKHHVFTLATCIENVPYTASCFYVYDEDLQLFIFMSDMHTRHSQQMEKNNIVAANILLETKVIGNIQGLQITGNVQLLEGELLKKATRKYLWKFPYVVLKQTTLWGLSPDFLKLTDNRLGFGKKLMWTNKVENND